MPAADDPNQRLERLRRYRNRPERDLTLSDLPGYFKREIARPHRQLVQIAEAWQQLVPAGLLEHTRLDAFARGVLRVSVDSAARHYELDRLLRTGLQTQLIRQLKTATLRRIIIRIAPLEDPAPPRQPPQTPLD